MHYYALLRASRSARVPPNRCVSRLGRHSPYCIDPPTAQRQVLASGPDVLGYHPFASGSNAKAGLHSGKYVVTEGDASTCVRRSTTARPEAASAASSAATATATAASSTPTASRRPPLRLLPAAATGCGPSFEPVLLPPPLAAAGCALGAGGCALGSRWSCHAAGSGPACCGGGGGMASRNSSSALSACHRRGHGGIITRCTAGHVHQRS